MMRTPARVPSSVPDPPKRLVPPTTIAAITCSSSPWPVRGLADASLPAIKMAPIPVSMPAKANTETMCRSMLMPEYRAAARLPPTA